MPSRTEPGSAGPLGQVLVNVSRLSPSRLGASAARSVIARVVDTSSAFRSGHNFGHRLLGGQFGGQPMATLDFDDVEKFASHRFRCGADQDARDGGTDFTRDRGLMFLGQIDTGDCVDEFAVGHGVSPSRLMGRCRESWMLAMFVAAPRTEKTHNL